METNRSTSTTAPSNQESIATASHGYSNIASQQQRSSRYSPICCQAPRQVRPFCAAASAAVAASAALAVIAQVCRLVLGAVEAAAIKAAGEGRPRHQCGAAAGEVFRPAWGQHWTHHVNVLQFVGFKVCRKCV